MCPSWLRAGNTDVCDSCARRKPIVPLGFFRAPELVEALGRYDFGPVFRAVRRYSGLSQQQLGERIGLAQKRISEVESGAGRLGLVETVAHVATALRIPGALLGFAAEPGSLESDGEVCGMERRNFLSLVFGITMSSTLQPDIARLSETLPAHAGSVRRREIGEADAVAIERLTEGFRGTIYSQGGGLMHAAALAQLRAVRSFDDAVCTEEIRARIDLATADLAWIAGWASWDLEEHDQARQLFAFGLNRAKRAEQHPRSTDLTIGILLDAAYQALKLRDGNDRRDPGREALRLVELGFNVANTSIHDASASARADLYASRAWCHGSLGHADQCHEALNREIDAFTAIQPDNVPHWARHVTEAEIASHRAHALALLGLAQPSFVPAAIEHLEAVANSADLTYARTRAFHLPYLSRLCLLGGDLDSGVRIGQEAITAINGLSSRHTRSQLQAIAETAAPFAATSSDVAQLREDVRVAVAA